VSKAIVDSFISEHPLFLYPAMSSILLRKESPKEKLAAALSGSASLSMQSSSDMKKKKRPSKQPPTKGFNPYERYARPKRSTPQRSKRPSVSSFSL
jgi:hypothetical protein